MSDRRIALRLGIEGGVEVKREISDITRAGEVDFNRLRDAAGRTGEVLKAQLSQIAAAAKQAALSEDVNRSWDRFLGVTNQVNKSARESASAFQQQSTGFLGMGVTLQSLTARFGAAYIAMRGFNEITESVRQTAALTDQQIEDLHLDKAMIEDAKAASKWYGDFFTWMRAQIASVATDWRVLGMGFTGAVAVGYERAHRAANVLPFAGPDSQNIAANTFLNDSTRDINNLIYGTQSPIQKYQADRQKYFADQAAKAAASDFATLHATANLNQQVKSTALASIKKDSDQDLKASLAMMYTGGGFAASTNVNDAEQMRQDIKKVTEAADDRIGQMKGAFQDLLRQYGDEARLAGMTREEQERVVPLLYARRDLGRDLTEEEAKQLSVLADQTIEIQKQSDLRDAISHDFQSWLKQVETTGKVSWKGLFQSIYADWLDMLNKMVSDELFSMIFGSGRSGGSSGGGFLATAASVIASIFHGGGEVGSGGTMRAVPASGFIGAPRYHGGINLAADERPAILQTGERVLSRTENANYGRAVEIHVHVDGATGNQEVQRMVAAGVAEGLNQYDAGLERRVLPIVKKGIKDPRWRG